MGLKQDHQRRVKRQATYWPMGDLQIVFLLSPLLRLCLLWFNFKLRKNDPRPARNMARRSVTDSLDVSSHEGGK
ncbi:hypothetical protein CEXT_393701 [Caerostris extrusa]|uniref:Uncharacterized protein n=1 Tax=Caerostris extrusa TaxID=172846 RepID=A0AAV4T3Z5_CAEEX|nr:hypothetical protein CEXT_393701 [Caerostris extrusa]